MGSTLLAIHSNPVTWPPPILSNLPSSSSLPLPECTLCAKVPAKAQSPSSQFHFSCDLEPTLQSFRECVDLQVTSCFHALSCTSPLTGQQGPLLGTQGPPRLLSSLLCWLLDKWVSSQISIYPSKLLIVPLVWTVPEEPPHILLTASNTCTHLYPTLHWTGVWLILDNEHPDDKYFPLYSRVDKWSQQVILVLFFDKLWNKRRLTLPHLPDGHTPHLSRWQSSAPAHGDSSQQTQQQNRKRGHPQPCSPRCYHVDGHSRDVLEMN